MFKAPYYKADGKKGRARPLPESLFDGVVNETALHQVVRAHLINRRQGTASAKNRATIRGGSRKPWRQKGTGRARQGSIRAPQWTGGARAFPPKPRPWTLSVPKKVRALARRSALNARARDGRVILVDRLEYEKPATRQLVQYLETVGADGKVLLLTDGQRQNVHLSGRNVQEIAVRPFGEESAYDVLWATHVVMERDAIDGLEDSDAPASRKREKEAEEAVAEDRTADASAGGAATATAAGSGEAAVEARKAEAEEAAADAGPETMEATGSEAEVAPAEAEGDAPEAEAGAPAKGATEAGDAGEESEDDGRGEDEEVKDA